MADEYIKRSDAINAYKTSRSKNNHRTTESSLVHIQEHNHILYILNKLPAADVVEVVHGEWKETTQPLGFEEVKCATCSACNDDWIMDEDVCIDDYKTHWKYCPNCGADMRGDKNG